LGFKVLLLKPTFVSIKESWNLLHDPNGQKKKIFSLGNFTVDVLRHFTGAQLKVYYALFIKKAIY